jgi:hypothetical protein
MPAIALLDNPASDDPTAVLEVVGAAAVDNTVTRTSGVVGLGGSVVVIDCDQRYQRRGNTDMVPVMVGVGPPFSITRVNVAVSNYT